MPHNENYIDGKEQKKSQTEEDKLKRLRSWKKQSVDSRTMQEVLWYEIQLFVDGMHWMKRTDNRSTGTTIRINPIPRRRGEVQRTFNKFRSMLRSLKATTTSTEVRFEVPGGNEDEVMSSNYLNWYIDTHDLTEPISDVVEHGFTRSVGYFDVYWDSVKAEPSVMARDPFDLLMDRHGKYACRTYTMRKEDFIDSKDSDGQPLFKNTKGIPISKKQSSSDILDNYLRSKYQDGGIGSEEGMESVMVEEYHTLEQKDDGKMHVRMVTAVEGGEVIHAEEVYDDDELRFISYWPERRPGDIYNEPWMKDALDPQRSLDNMYTHFEEFIRTMGKGRYLKRKDGTNLDRIIGENGQIVEWSGEKPDYLEMGHIGNDQFNFDRSIEGKMEDVIGIHPSEYARQETAKGLGYLIAQDQTNISEPFKNLKSSLLKVGKRLLKLANRHMVASEEIFWWNNDQRETGRVIGSVEAPEGVKQITNIKGLVVDLIPKGAFAALTREAKVTQLVQAGILTNPEVIAEAMNLGNVREIYEKELAFRQQQSQLNAQNSQNPQAPAGQASPQGTPETNEEPLRALMNDIRQDIGV